MQQDALCTFKIGHVVKFVRLADPTRYKMALESKHLKKNEKQKKKLVHWM